MNGSPKISKFFVTIQRSLSSKNSLVWVWSYRTVGTELLASPSPKVCPQYVLHMSTKELISTPKIKTKQWKKNTEASERKKKKDCMKSHLLQSLRKWALFHENLRLQWIAEHLFASWMAAKYSHSIRNFSYCGLLYKRTTCLCSEDAFIFKLLLFKIFFLFFKITANRAH